jgi:hypothetical protein
MGRRSLWALLACLCTLGALLACGRAYPPGMAPNPTPPLVHGPGLQLAAGLNHLRDLGYEVTSAPFQQQGRPWQILLNQPVHGLFIANLDGTTLRQVVKDQTCTTQASVTRDGMWAICRTMSSVVINSFAVEVISLNPAGPPQHDEPQLDPGVSREELAISPDGAYFAALTDTPSALCAIGIYELTGVNAQATLATTLTSDMFNLSEDFSNGSDSTPLPSRLRCSITRFDWSSDGARLFVATRRIGVLPKGADSHGQIFVDAGAPVAALISNGTRVASLPVASFIAIPDPNILASAPQYVGLPQYVWNPLTAALAFAQGGTLGGNEPGMLMEYQPGDQQARALFTLPYAGYPILSLGWAGDGSRLLVGIGGLLCGDCRIGVQTWYLYTPAGA